MTLEMYATISLYLTVGIGLGVLILGLLYVWNQAITYLLAFLKLHDLFVRFMYAYYRKKYDKEGNK